MTTLNLSHLHTNQRLLVESLLNNGAEVKILNLYDELLEVKYKGKTDFLLDRFSSVVPFHSVKMTADKHFAKERLNNYGIKTPHGSVFTNTHRQEALLFSQSLYPLVLKPNWGSHGDHVHVNIRNELELNLAIDEFIQKTHINNPFIIEKFYPWSEYRLFITSLGGFAAVQREPASIVGNGSSTLRELIEVENNFRLQLKKEKSTSICPIVVDEEVLRYLNFQNIKESLSYTPLENEKIFLRHESNLAKGGQAIDVTDIIHPSIKELASSCLNAFPGLPVAGLDLLCPNIFESIHDDNYVILEVNSSPGLSMHAYPTHGKSQDVATLLMNVMFPE